MDKNDLDFEGSMREMKNERERYNVSGENSSGNLPRELLRKITDGLILYEDMYGLLYANPSMVKKLGNNLIDIYGEDLMKFVAPEYREMMNSLLSTPSGSECEIDILNTSGDRIPVKLKSDEIFINNDRIKLLTFKNNTETRKLRENLKESGKKFRTLIRKSSEIIGVIDSDGIIEYLSDSLEGIFGYSPYELIGRDFFENIHESDRKSVIKDFNKCIYSKNLYVSSMFKYMHKENSWRHAEIIFSNLMQDNLINGIVFNLRDITDKKKAEDLAAHLQLHDFIVTKLPNIGYFKNRLQLELIKVNEREDTKLVGVMSIGLDRFKNINNLYGSETGDMLLNSIARRLRMSFRDDDVVARFGGDVFIILLTNIARDYDLKDIIQKTESIFAEPFTVKENEINVQVSIGFSLYPHDSDDADLLINNSQAAMYRVKENGGGSYSLFDYEMHEALINALQMELEMKFALRHDEFVSYYQPKFDREGNLVSIESLIRWNSEKRGMVSPGEFIPLVEKNGMIGDIGYLILRKACQQAMKWHERGYGIPMCVNVSPAQFKDPNLVDRVEEIISETGIKTELLEFEITESGIMENAREGLFKLFKIRSLGVKIAMDDFGTGLSSLSNLISYPIDVLKIDKSFVDKLPDNEEAKIVVNSIIDLSGNLGFKVVAEGIENEEQLKYLRERRCDMFQGFYFSKPLSAEDFEEKYFS